MGVGNKIECHHRFISPFVLLLYAPHGVIFCGSYQLLKTAAVLLSLHMTMKIAG